MTALNKDNIPAAIDTLEGLVAWAVLTYNAASGHASYQETSTLDVQKLASYGITPVVSEIGGTSLFLVGRVAIPVDKNLLAAGTVAWLGVVQHDGAVALPAGYTV